MFKYLVSAVVIVLLGAGVWLALKPVPIVESLPPKVTYVNANEDMIRVIAPHPGESVDGTFTVLGQARGNWYFEANFPVEVVGENGARLVQVPVPAQGDWMTTEFVPFSVSITVPNYTGPATLILRNDNASGLPEHDRSVSIPIVIK